MDVEGVAVELYRLPPAQFTSARNKRAAELAAEGDRELAGAIRTLPKASATAWALNQLSAEAAETKEEFARLRGELDAAYLHPDRQTLAELSTERKRLVGETAKAAAELAEQNGVHLSASARTELEQTLLAAVADRGAAAAVFSGRLVRSLQAIGLEEVALAGAVGGPDPEPLPPASSTKRPRKPASRANLDRERAKAVDEAKRSESVAAEADRAVASIEKQLQSTERDSDALGRELEELRAELETLQGRQREFTARQDELRHERKKAMDAARRARNAAETAQERVDRLQ